MFFFAEPSGFETFLLPSLASLVLLSILAPKAFLSRLSCLQPTLCPKKNLNVPETGSESAEAAASAKIVRFSTSSLLIERKKGANLPAQRASRPRLAAL